MIDMMIELIFRGQNHLKLAAASILVIMAGSWITTFLIAMKWDYFARVEVPFALFDQLYDKPWLRVGPYLIGMLVGHFLFKIECQIKIPPTMVILGWVLSLSCMGSLVYGLGREGLRVPTSAFYVSYFMVCILRKDVI